MKRSSLLLVVLLAVCPVRGQDKPVPAAEAPGRMTLPDGFRATLFAGEPDVVQPIAMTTDDRGRLWVVECLSYPRWSSDGKGEDRVKILEDTDGDGRFDKKTIFYDKGSNLSGITLGFGGVWLCSLPNLIFIPDKDGDDKPDGPPEVLLDGWSLECKHNVFNSLNWGPDGWLYGCNGITATSKVGKPGTPDKERVPMNCGVWRYHPTRKVFEVVAWGTTNPFGLDWDENGEMFITNCVIGHLWHVIPGAHYERMYGQDLNPHVYGLMKMCADHIHWAGGNWTTSRGGTGKHGEAGGGHAHAGCMIYLGDNWPDRYRNTVFMGNIHGNRLNNDILERQGSGYVARHGRDFLFANDPWFRPLAMMYGPDGGVYVADWCDTGECHDYDDIHRENGRIFKITYGKPKPWQGDLAKLTDKELWELQSHKNEWFVRHSRRLLQERAAAKRLLDNAGLDFVRAAGRLDARTRLRLLWTDFAIHSVEKHVSPIGGFSDSDESIQAWAIRLAVDGTGPLKDADFAILTEMAQGVTSPKVRLSLVAGLQRLPLEQRWTLARWLIDHVEDGQDSALPLMIWYGMESLVSADPARAVQLVEHTRLPLVREFITRRLASLPKAELAPLIGLLLAADNPTIHRDLLRGLQDAWTGQRQVAMPSGWDKAFPILAESPLPEVRERATALAVLFGDERALKSLRKTVLDSNAPTEVRNRALTTLVFKQPSDLPELLRGLLADKAIRGAAIRGLAAVGDDATPAAILKVYSALTAEEKADAIHTLSSRPAYALALLDAVEKGTIPCTDVSAFNARQLLALNDKAVSAKLKSVWGEVRPASQEKTALMTRFKGQLTPDTLKKGNLARGRQLYVKHCAACHKLFDEGSAIGPELTGSQRGNLDYLLENLLDPSALVGKDYQVTVLVTTTGRTITGIIKQETDKAVSLQTQNEVVVVPRDEIDERHKSPVSMMPEGLLDKLSQDEVRDLIAYLSSPVQVPLPASAPP